MAGELSPPSPRIWRTNDGREIACEDMGTDHIRNAQAAITPWSKGERDIEKRKELRAWRKTFGRELRRRQKAAATSGSGFQRPSAFGGVRGRAPRVRAPDGDHWTQILSISLDASLTEIEIAFREIAKLAHPDTGGSAAAMRQLVEARARAIAERSA